jgi:hypothetical protein
MRDSARAALDLHLDQLGVLQALRTAFASGDAGLREQTQRVVTELVEAPLPEYVTLLLQDIEDVQERRTSAAWMMPSVERMMDRLMVWQALLRRVQLTAAVGEGEVLAELLAYTHRLLDRFLILRDTLQAVFACSPEKPQAELETFTHPAAVSLTDMTLNPGREMAITSGLRVLADRPLTGLVLNTPVGWAASDISLLDTTPGSPQKGVDEEEETFFVPSEPIGDTTGVFYGESGAAGGALKKVITGYTLPEDKSAITSETVTLQVSPPERVDHVALAWQDPEKRAKFDLDFKGAGRQTQPDGTPGAGGVWRDRRAGTIQFRVKGIKATPKEKPEGDTMIIASDGGPEIAKVQVVVVIPKAIDPDAARPNVFNGVVSGKNRVLGPTTSPGLYFDFLNEKILATVTVYQTDLTIIIVDQFGQPVKIYANKALIEEKKGGQWHNTNLKLKAAGTYIDPVGTIVYLDPVSTTDDSQPLQPQIAYWEGRTPAYEVSQFTETQDIPVWIRGHEILSKPEGTTPAIKGRQVSITPDASDPKKAKITIIWPK